MANPSREGTYPEGNLGEGAAAVGGAGGDHLALVVQACAGQEGDPCQGAQGEACGLGVPCHGAGPSSYHPLALLGWGLRLLEEVAGEQDESLTETQTGTDQEHTVSNISLTMQSTKYI